jgi:hypothetical protein
MGPYPQISIHDPLWNQTLDDPNFNFATLVARTVKDEPLADRASHCT